MERYRERPDWFFTAALWGKQARAQCLLPIPFHPLRGDSSCTGQMGISVIGSPSMVRGESQAGSGPGHSSQSSWSGACRERAALWNSSQQGFLLSQQSSSSSFFIFFFHPHLFEGFNCLTSGTSSTLHWPSGRGCTVY